MKMKQMGMCRIYLVLLMEIPAITGIKGRVLHMSAMDITHAMAICSSASITFTSEAFHGPSKMRAAVQGFAALQLYVQLIFN